MNGSVLVWGRRLHPPLLIRLQLGLNFMRTCICLTGMTDVMTTGICQVAG